MVLQDWLQSLSYKQQSVLLSALRGCDGVRKNDPSKAVVRQLRNDILKNADGQEAFMSNKRDWKAIQKLTTHMDRYPMHYIMHGIQAMEILGYYHPDPEIAEYWNNAYTLFVRKLHLQPETKAENAERLRDTRKAEKQVFHYINLTNGIDAIPTLPSSDYRFVRIQSTVCEQHLWDKLLLELSDDLLMNLALGHPCIIYDFGAGKPVPKSVYQGLEFIRYVLYRRWLHETYHPVIRRHNYTEVNCDHIFDHYYRNLSRPAKRKIDYFRSYLDTDKIYLTAKTDRTAYDGDKIHYRDILIANSRTD